MKTISKSTSPLPSPPTKHQGLRMAYRVTCCGLCFEVLLLLPSLFGLLEELEACELSALDCPLMLGKDSELLRELVVTKKHAHHNMNSKAPNKQQNRHVLNKIGKASLTSGKYVSTLFQRIANLQGLEYKQDRNGTVRFTERLSQ